MSINGIIVDLTKIEAFHDWTCPTSSTEVCSFIDLDSYYGDSLRIFLLYRVDHQIDPESGFFPSAGMTYFLCIKKVDGAREQPLLMI